MADHRRDAREHADEVPAEPEPEQRRDGALGDVEQRDGDPEPEPERAPDVGRARVAAPQGAHVDAPEQPGEPVPPRHAAEDVARSDEKRVLYGSCLFR